MSLPRYQRILVGTDGSSLAGPTVERAARLAHDEDADLIIVCAYTQLTARDDAKQTITPSLPTLGQVPGKVASSLALSQAQQIAHDAGAFVTAALLVDAEPVTALLETAKDHQADLIVIGAIRDTSIVGRLLGTVASEVVRQATCEVLIVRPQPGDEPPNVAEDLTVASAPPTGEEQS